MYLSRVGLGVYAYPSVRCVKGEVTEIAPTWAVIAASLLMITVGANEASHGEVAEMMGFGHHHMADYGGYHCSGHNGSTHAGQHAEHMHGGAVDNTSDQNASEPYHEHAACYDEGEEGMGQQESPRGSGPHMGGG